MEATAQLVNLIDDIKDKISDDEYLKLMNCALIASRHAVKEADLSAARDTCQECSALGMLCECSAHDIFNHLLDLQIMIPDLYRVIATLNLEKYHRRP